jgi:hypothetical protein
LASGDTPRFEIGALPVLVRAIVGRSAIVGASGVATAGMGSERRPVSVVFSVGSSSAAKRDVDRCNQA